MLEQLYDGERSKTAEVTKVSVLKKKNTIFHRRLTLLYLF